VSAICTLDTGHQILITDHTPMKSELILFLDFDGVLHPDPPHSAAPLMCRAPLMQAWLEQNPQVGIVISSTWRLKRTLDELQIMFPQWGDRIRGVTPEIPQEIYQRQAECESWMRDHSDPWTPWIALDDRAWNFRPFEKRLILTDRNTGLVEADLVRLSKAWRH
jgi:hypothetical protein